MRRVHAVANGTPETVEEDLAVMPRRVRRSLLNQLAEGERIIVRTRQSPQVLLQDAGWPLLALAVWVFLVAKVGVTPQLSDVVFVAFLVASARLVWKEAQRRYSWFVATNRRVLKHSGIIIHKVPMMLLRKVTDMTYSRSLLGQIGGYGTILFESAGQQQAIRELTFVPDPDAVAQALNAEIYGTRPRRSTTSRDRSWPRLPRRPRRGGAGPEPGSGGPDDPGGDGGPPRGRGPGPRGPRPPGAGGGVDVSPTGRPARRTRPETWYRSSNLGAPWRTGDTGEIPVVQADDVDRWRAAGRPGRREEPFDQDDAHDLVDSDDDVRAMADERPRDDGDADPFDSWEHPSEDDGPRWVGRHRRPPAASGGADDGHDPDAAREIPLYPPSDWVDRR